MSSPAKQPQKKGGWGSLLSGAVANLESRLDTILAEDSEASARQRAGETVATKDANGKPRQRTNSGTLVPPAKSPAPGSRDASRTRINDRLAERLAKATAAKKAGGEAASGVPSRVMSPANDPSRGRASGESRMSVESARTVPEVEGVADARPEIVTEEKGEVSGIKSQEIDEANGVESHGTDSTLLTSGLPINPAKVSEDGSRSSVEVSIDAASSGCASSELANGHSRSTKDAAELQAEMAQMRDDYAAAEKQRQEEMHTYLEKIDALQAKLKYLANETVAAAKAANAEAGVNNDGAKLAEKDERIALLMEEGEKLSKTELRHMQTIKKLRGSTIEKDKAMSELSRRLERAEKVEAELKQRLRRSEVVERQAEEKARQILGIESQVEELRVDRENASELIRSLTSQLKEAKERASRVEKEASSKAAEVDRDTIASLENELEDAQIEKKLAEDRATAETKRAREEVERQRERFSLRETELKDEVVNLESRVEAIRSRAEEASSDAGNAENNVMLLRQVETLQSQYSLAKANWETIERALDARVSLLERERDEAVKREGDVRKKARDAALGKRRAEEETEGLMKEVELLRQEVKNYKEAGQEAQRKLEKTESTLSEARMEYERQKRVWDAESTQRVEEEKARMLQSHVPASYRTDSPATSGRKSSAVDLATGLRIAPSRRSPNNRVTSHDLTALNTHQTNPPTQARPISRQSRSAMPTPASTSIARFPPPHHPFDRSSTSTSTSPAISRQESALSLLASPSDSGLPPPTPSIEIDHQDFDTSSQSPERTINDLMSTSTAGAGPSVQLVERMSAAVRRLESEKAAFRDELARLSTQRDEAREEVVSLMREIEGVKKDEARTEVLEKGSAEMKRRYEALLEMLGEKEEEVEGLRGDVGELKRMYRVLVEEKMPVR
ncbi:hypothetical protein B0A55_06184 [Friedmanniomyces simplex]|uniref:TATA element modulatory factor 1 TATA binding domain-containing protein n=1 Tax=Friedmanniomyces simplex TaxID=329884 RepID=A0A4U0XA49_9PEZI|nr:hypothetical protein B0A55_06184 [Friedmanniomyces simplex]